MESTGNQRSRLLTAGGILSIVAGVLVIISGVLIVIPLDPVGYGWRIAMQYIQAVWWWFLLLLLPFLREGALGFLNLDLPTFMAIIVGFVVVLGIIALAGGISSIRRKSFGLSLAGAVCALPVMFVGILAVIFVAIRKREFKAKEVDAEVV
jgi:hypothetical protein